MSLLRETQLQCSETFADTSDIADGKGPFLDAPRLHAAISVYQNNLHVTLTNALNAGFPIVAQLVGEQCFVSLARLYAQRHPSRAPDLQDFGQYFPSFLQKQYHDGPYRYLADVAALERATEDVLAEAEPPPPDKDALNTLDAQTLPHIRLARASGTRIVTSDFPLLDIWRMHNSADAKPANLDSGPCSLVVVRHRHDALLLPISHIEFEMAELLMRGKSIGQAFIELSAQADVTALNASLCTLLRHRLFSHPNR